MALENTEWSNVLISFVGDSLREPLRIRVKNQVYKTLPCVSLKIESLMCHNKDSVVF